MELSQLEQIYRTYDRELAEANRKSSIFAGIFGQGTLDDPRNAPCNKAFYESTGQWVKEFAQTNPAQEEILAVWRFLMDAAANRVNKPTYWYILVAQGYVRELIPLLEEGNRAILAKEFDNLYPKRRRLPLQEELYRMLTNSK